MSDRTIQEQLEAVRHLVPQAEESIQPQEPKTLGELFGDVPRGTREGNPGRREYPTEEFKMYVSKEDIEKLTKLKMDLLRVESAERRSSKFLTWALTAALTAAGISCLAMVGRSCMNKDKSPKFHL